MHTWTPLTHARVRGRLREVGLTDGETAVDGVVVGVIGGVDGEERHVWVRCGREKRRSGVSLSHSAHGLYGDELRRTGGARWAAGAVVVGSRTPGKAASSLIR